MAFSAGGGLMRRARALAIDQAVIARFGGRAAAHGFCYDHSRTRHRRWRPRDGGYWSPSVGTLMACRRCSRMMEVMSALGRVRLFHRAITAAGASAGHHRAILGNYQVIELAELSTSPIKVGGVHSRRECLPPRHSLSTSGECAALLSTPDVVHAGQLVGLICRWRGYRASMRGDYMSRLQLEALAIITVNFSLGHSFGGVPGESASSDVAAHVNFITVAAYRNARAGSVLASRYLPRDVTSKYRCLSRLARVSMSRATTRYIAAARPPRARECEDARAFSLVSKVGN